MLVLARLVKDGMFTDGVLYASVAHNLAIGKGSFWHPYFDKYMFPFFHQQPPLTFGIQALFFKLFGDSIYVERVYSFLTVCISAWLISKLWKIINAGKEESANMTWLPVLLWIIIPTCFWAYSNNMEENTMGVFILLSVLLIYKGLQKQNIALVVFGSAVTVLASLCKGFPGLFPIIIPVVYFVFTKHNYSKVKALVFSVVAIITPLVIYALLLMNDTVYSSLNAYLNDRVLHSIEEVSTVNSRFALLGQLFFIQLLPPISVVLLVLLVSGLKNVRVQFADIVYKRNILLFFIIGITASFPLIVTREQRAFYLVPSFPYYAIALALIAAPSVSSFIKRLNVESVLYKVLLGCSVVFVVVGLVVSGSGVGKVGRDADKLHDVYSFGKIIPAGSDVNVLAETWDDWSLHNYFVRSFNISLDMDSTKHEYFIFEKGLNKPQPPSYKILETGEKYDLYKRQ